MDKFKKILVLSGIIISTLLVGCTEPKEIVSDTIFVEDVVIKNVYKNTHTSTAGYVTTTHWLEKVELNYKGNIIIRKDYDLYNYCKDKIGKTVKGHFIKRTYSNGDVDIIFNSIVVKEEPIIDDIIIKMVDNTNKLVKLDYKGQIIERNGEKIYEFAKDKIEKLVKANFNKRTLLNGREELEFIGLVKE